MKAFQQLDKDGSGTLTAEEVAAAIGMTGRMSESEVREMIERYDCNGNGVIDFAEFLEVRCVCGGGGSLAPGWLPRQPAQPVCAPTVAQFSCLCCLIFLERCNMFYK